jgi:hypothetical protein
MNQKVINSDHRTTTAWALDSSSGAKLDLVLLQQSWANATLLVTIPSSQLNKSRAPV